MNFERKECLLLDVCIFFFKNDPSKLDQYGKILLHGKGYDRWFDKSFTLCIGNNGRVSYIIISAQ